jgi:TatD DNase family protein
MWIDSHAHLDAEVFDDDRAEALARARAAGVEVIVLAGAARTIEDLDRTVATAESDAAFYATAGVHPHEARFWSPALAERVRELARHPKVVGVGETGLDYHYDHSPRPDQREVFAAHVEIAREADLPVICHVRDAHADAATILEATGAAAVGGVIHCFTGGPADAEAYLALGFHISFSGIVTFRGKSAEPIREAARQVPADRLLLETDCPYLAPMPMRGKRNEPAYLVHTAAFVAELRAEPLEALAEATAANTRRLFGLRTLTPEDQRTP